MGTTGQCQVTASPEQAHAMAGGALELLHVVTAAPRAGASLLPGSGTHERLWPCQHSPAATRRLRCMPLHPSQEGAVPGQARGSLGPCCGSQSCCIPWEGPTGDRGDAAGGHLLTPARPRCPALPRHHCLLHRPRRGGGPLAAMSGHPSSPHTRGTPGTGAGGNSHARMHKVGCCACRPGPP